VGIDGADHRDQDRGEQNHEAPEDRGVHQARYENLQQLALPDDDQRFGAYASRDIVEASHRLAHPDEAVELNRAAPEESRRNHQRGGYGYGWDGVQRDFRISAEIAGTISFRSPITA
jgi:hypothetical protein